MNNDSSSSRDGYDATFWLAYLSNGLTTLANAMLVRYADFVSVLGGEERQLGLIVGAGMIGSIAMRLVQGEAIDRYGAGRVWRWSISLYFISLLLHLTLDSAYSPAIFVVRIAMQSTLAGMFGSSITFVSLRVPPPRMAEMIGALGTSGFIGILVGPLVSDWIGSSSHDPRLNVERMFWGAAACAFVSAITAWLATQGEPRPTPRRRPHLGHVLRRYFPFMLAMAAAAMGAGFSIPMSFLRPFAKEYDLGGVGVFFAVYASTAFAARIASRSLFERHGNRPWIILGLALLAISYVAYLPVQRPWQLGFPGAIAGVAHALLFPAIMAAGTSAFPRRYLGVATSFMLAMFDFGTLLGAPLVGSFLRWAKTQGWPDYPAMFSAVAGVLTLVTFSFWSSRAGMARPAKRAAPTE
jgi:MFS family permease